MTWRSHRLLTGVTVLLVTHDVWFTLSSVCGSTFPDRVEQVGLGDWRRYHRKLSHWFVLYVFLLGLVEVFSVVCGEQLQFLLFLKWFFVGCLCHILEDAVSGRVPVWSPGKSKQVLPRLCYTGSLKEDVIVCFYLVLAVGVFYVNYIYGFL